MKIFICDVDEVRFCYKGCREFFLRHNLDWHDFRLNGIDIKVLENIDDAMVKQLIERVKHGRK